MSNPIEHSDDNGKLHDKYGPIIHRDSSGRLHCDNGPAVVLANEHIEYWIHGELHNTKGPAIIYSDGYAAYCIHGERCYTANRYQQLAKISDKQLAMIVLKYGAFT